MNYCFLKKEFVLSYVIYSEGTLAELSQIKLKIKSENNKYLKGSYPLSHIYQKVLFLGNIN